jgi:hypothetical protein
MLKRKPLMQKSVKAAPAKGIKVDRPGIFKKGK